MQLEEPAMNPELSIILIHWKIKKGCEPEFEEKWKTVYTVRNRDGLIGEYLSKVEKRGDIYPYITWPIACANLADEMQCTHYINVGIWNSHARFYEEVGHNMKDDEPPKSFEIERRRRIAITPAEWRRGPAGLPPKDSEGTE
jgi:hypothetical protein